MSWLQLVNTTVKKTDIVLRLEERSRRGWAHCFPKRKAHHLHLQQQQIGKKMVECQSEREKHILCGETRGAAAKHKYIWCALTIWPASNLATGTDYKSLQNIWCSLEVLTSGIIRHILWHQEDLMENNFWKLIPEANSGSVKNNFLENSIEWLLRAVPDTKTLGMQFLN